MKAIDKNRLPELLKAMSGQYSVLVPTEKDGISKFVPYQEGNEVKLAGNTTLPPKDILFPQTEKMYKFKTKGQEVAIEEIAQPMGKRVLFGIRSCDVQSIDRLDDVFLTKGFVDDFYKDKRDNTILIALACTKPMDTCFCESMGLNPQDAKGADIQAYDLGQTFGFEARTPAGEELLQKVAGLLADSEALPLPMEAMSLKADVEGVPEKLAQMFNHPVWDEISETCMGCGTCAYFCPTCHCFDISGSVKGDTGYKFRCWDCCMFSEYTRMAGGHNPRPSKKERVRNRFMHKIYYFNDRYGKLLCTGCGRCIAKCPVNLDITAVIKKIKEAELS